ncbi:MAG: arginase family protein [Candidatus Bathyarchaeia archaeon]|jgi:arginase
MRSISLIGVPLYTLTKNSGIGLGVQTLRNLGIDRALRERCAEFRDCGDIALPPLSRDNGPSNNRNSEYFLKCTDVIFDASNGIREQGLSFYLGGECGLVVGSAAGLKQQIPGKPGLLWIDAHGDFNTPETSPSGFVGGMPLAFVCGRGPRFSQQIENQQPIIEENAVVHLGGRERDFDPLESEALRSSRVKVYSPSEFQENPNKLAVEIAETLAKQSDWIICHLDVDAIDPTIMPAVNYPCRNGLTPEDVKTVVAALSKTGKLRVFNLTAYNSTLDKDGGCGKTILDLVAKLPL